MPNTHNLEVVGCPSGSACDSQQQSARDENNNSQSQSNDLCGPKYTDIKQKKGGGKSTRKRNKRKRNKNKTKRKKKQTILF